MKEHDSRGFWGLVSDMAVIGMLFAPAGAVWGLIERETAPEWMAIVGSISLLVFWLARFILWDGRKPPK